MKKQTDDLISKKDVLDALTAYERTNKRNALVYQKGYEESLLLHDIMGECMEVVREVPPAQIDCSDCIEHGGDWECDRKHCRKGTQKVKYWRVYEVANTEEEQPIAWQCMNCGEVVGAKYNFCPNCGIEVASVNGTRQYNVETLRPAIGWVRCDEELPKKAGSYIVATDDGRVIADYWANPSGMGKHCLAWLELPEYPDFLRKEK